MKTKFDLQDDLYAFPYHYLPTLDADGAIRLHRQLAWGLEYLTYMTFVAKLVQTQGVESLLDVGCGDGRLLHMLRGQVPRLSGVDLSPRAIVLAQALNPDLDFLCADVAQIQDRYAMVSLIEVLEHIPDEPMADFLTSVAQRLDAAGQLLVSVPTVNVPLNPKHYRHYDLPMLQTTLSPHFEIAQHWWLYRQGNLSEWLARRLLCNSVYTLNQSRLTALIWRWHRRKNYFAEAGNGAHLVALARPRR